MINPYVAGGLFADYLVRGRFHFLPKHPQILTPDNLLALTGSPGAVQNPDNAGAQAPSAASSGIADTQATAKANSGLREIKDKHE